MRGSYFLILTLFFTFDLVAQTAVEVLMEREAQIDSLYSIEQYAKVIPLMDAQFEAIKGTAWQDTLYAYCYNYARCHWKVNGAERGVEAAERIIREVEKNGDPVKLLACYSDLSWIYYEVGEVEKCRYIDSIALVVSERGGVPLILKGRSRSYLGFDYVMLGDHSKAIDHYFAAYEIFKQIEPRDSIARQYLSESSNGIAASAWHLGQNSTAEKYYLEALDWIGDSQNHISLSRRASTLGNLALMFDDLGDLVKCKAYYTENLRLCNLIVEESEDPFLRDEMMLGRSRTHGNLASLYHSLGDYNTSKSYLDLANKDRVAILEPDDPKRLVILESYADLEIAKGNYKAAETLINQYLVASLEHYGSNSAYTADAYIGMAKAVAEQGDLARADSLFELGIRCFRTVSSEETNTNIAIAYLQRGTMNLDAGSISKAKDEIQKSIDIYIASFGPNNRKVARARTVLAKCYIASGEYEEALEELDRSLEILSPRMDTNEARNVGHVDQLPYLLPEVIYYKVLAQRKSPKGMDNATALQELEIARKALQQNKTGLRDEESKLLLVGAQKKVYDLTMDIAYQEYEKNKDTEALEQLISASEENKTIILKEKLNMFKSLSFAGVPDSIIEREQQLLKELNEGAVNYEMGRQLSKTEQEHEALVHSLQEKYPAYFELRYGENSISVTDVQERLLAPDQLLLAYALTDENIYITVIGKDKAEVTSTETTDLKEKISAMNKAIATRDMDAYLGFAFDIHEHIVQPVVEHLDKEQLLIVPDEEMYYLNFEVLLNKKSTADDHTSNLLINDHVISYLISATTALQFQGLKEDKNRGVLALAPGFSDDMKEEYLSSVPDSSVLDPFYIKQLQQPFAVETAEGLGQMMKASVLTGNAANETAFKDKAEEYGIIHLGTHTEINNAAPLYSKLVLSKSAGEDGYLHAYELYDMELKAELAVLTACETGTGKQSSSEGVRSLAHSFAYAGCPSLVMSLWKIDEKTSSEIITKFYENLSDGQAKNVALRNAKLEYLEGVEGDLNAPFYWAGMVLVGDASPVEVGSSVVPIWVYLIITVLAVVIIRGMIKSRNKKPRD